MKNDEKEMNLEDVGKELILAKYEYRDIEDVDFNPVSKRFEIISFLLNILFLSFLTAVTYIPKIGLLITLFATFLWIPLVSLLFSCPYYLLKKFELSDFSIDDLNAIKSNPFLSAEFKKNLVNNDTEVSSKFSKISINYRNELKKKIDRLSNLKEQLEREILIASMQ